MGGHSRTGVKLLPTAQVYVWEPKDDGYLSTGNFHWGRDWNWIKQLDDKATKKPGEKWALDHCEIIEPLNAISPTSYVLFEDMDTDDWTVITGGQKWRTAKINKRPHVDYLHYIDASATSHSVIKSKGTYWPMTNFSIVMYDPNEESVQATAGLSITFNCDYTDSTSHQYRILLPIDNEHMTDYPGSTDKKACIQYREYNDSTSAWGKWYTIVETNKKIGTGGKNKPSVITLQVERVAGYHIIVSLEDDQFLIPYDSTRETLSRGTITLESWQAYMVNISPLGFVCWYTDPDDEEGTHILPSATPLLYDTSIDYICNKTLSDEDIKATYKVYHACTGTDTIGITEQWYTVGDSGLTARGTRPKMSFVAEDGVMTTDRTRPIIFNLTQYNPPVVTYAGPVTASFAIEPKSVSWSRDNSWRQENFTVAFDDFDGTIGEIPINSPVKVLLGYHTNDDETVISDKTLYGYTLESYHQRDGSQFMGALTPKLACADGIAARLTGHVYMRDFGSFMGYTVEQAFKMILNSAGIPNDLITVSCTGYNSTLPGCTFPTDNLSWTYDDSYDVVSAIDHLVEYINSQTDDDTAVQWGVSHTGYFLRDKPQWVQGTSTPDWLLYYDQDVVVDDGTDGWEDPNYDIVTEASITKGGSEFKNVVLIKYAEKKSMYYDISSIDDDTDDFYVGQARFVVETAPDEVTQTELDAIALKRYAASLEKSMVLTVRTPKLDLAPDMFVAVKMNTPEFKNGRIFRVVKEDGEITEDGEVSVTYVMEGAFDTWLIR